MSEILMVDVPGSFTGFYFLGLLGLIGVLIYFLFVIDIQRARGEEGESDD